MSSVMCMREREREKGGCFHDDDEDVLMGNLLVKPDLCVCVCVCVCVCACLHT